MSENGDPKASSTVVVGVVGAILLLAIILFTQVLFSSAQRMEDERKLYVPRQELADLRFKQLAQIEDRRFIDPGRRVVALPIDDAIELFVTGVKPAPVPTTIPAAGSEPTSRPTTNATTRSAP